MKTCPKCGSHKVEIFHPDLDWCLECKKQFPPTTDIPEYSDVQINKIQKHVQTIVNLLELGDQRLLTSDGSCEKQNAVTVLSPQESHKLYKACKRITNIHKKRWAERQ